MEHDIVFSDKVYQAGFGIFPPCFPTIGKKFFGVGDVSDGGVEPYVKHLSFRSFYGNGDTPVEVTAYGTRLQSHVEPALTLAVHVRAPFLVVFENPFAQPAFVFVEREIPVFGFFHHRFAAADSAFRVDKVCRRERSSAFLALVAIGTFRVAVRTFAGDITVGKECFCFFVVILLGSLFDKFSLVI